MRSTDPDFRAAMEALEARVELMDADMASRVGGAPEDGVRRALDPYGLVLPEWSTRLMTATTCQLLSELRLRVFRGHLLAIEIGGDRSVVDDEGLRRAGTYLKRADKTLHRILRAVELVEAAERAYDKALERRESGFKRLQDRPEE